MSHLNQLSRIERSSKLLVCTSLVGCMKETLWIQKFRAVLEEVWSLEGLYKMFRISIGEDSMGCMSDGKNPTVSNISKLVDLIYRLLIDYITKEVDIHYVKTNKMNTDVLTNTFRESWVQRNGAVIPNCLSQVKKRFGGGSMLDSCDVHAAKLSRDGSEC